MIDLTETRQNHTSGPWKLPSKEQSHAGSTFQRNRIVHGQKIVNWTTFRQLSLFWADFPFLFRFRNSGDVKNYFVVTVEYSATSNYAPEKAWYAEYWRCFGVAGYSAGTPQVSRYKLNLYVNVVNLKGISCYSNCIILKEHIPDLRVISVKILLAFQPT